MDWDIEKTIIFETLFGSQMYGTSTPESDTDYRGVCIPPLDVRNNLFHGFEQADSFPGQDRCIYSLAKFFKLCADGNPNIIELLFSPEMAWKTVNAKWLDILAHKDIFLSKKIKYTFTGYAFSQLKAIQNHRQWFLNPPDHQPMRSEFGLGGAPVVSGEALTGLSNVPFELLTDSARDEVRRELEYRKAKTAWDNYISWRDNRNPKRRDMENRWGYDTKHAMHLIRLMLEGEELLLHGTITFPLKQADYLLEIRNGLLEYEQVIIIANGFQSRFDEWYEQSGLPRTPDTKAIQSLYKRLI